MTAQQAKEYGLIDDIIDRPRSVGRMHCGSGTVARVEARAICA